MNALSAIVLVVSAAMLLLLLGAIIRFSAMSSWRARGARDRLTHADPAGVERVCGFPVPSELVELYQEGSLTRLSELALVDKSQQPRKTWFFGGFYPLTAEDVLEQKKIHGITTGIPIADDSDKGVYFVARDGRIMFRPAGRERGITEVASSADALSRFERVGGEETEAPR
jgi:hypothetical protein